MVGGAEADNAMPGVLKGVLRGKIGDVLEYATMDINYFAGCLDILDDIVCWLCGVLSPTVSWLTCLDDVCGCIGNGLTTVMD